VKDHVIISFFIPHLGCASNCVFCNQKTISGKDSAPSYIDVARTIDEHLSSQPEPAICEVAFYGGSFTALPREQQLAYLHSVQPFLESGRISGIRISTRPDAIDQAGLEMLAGHGVRTIELGVQSLHPEVLKASGRDYEPSLVGKVSLLIKQQGFILGHQLMVGLPGSNLALEMDTARQVIRIRPDVVRIYPTLVLKGTRLARLYYDGKYQPLSLQEAIDATALMLTQFEKAGIKVIRMGLQASPELQEPGEVLAGPFHPSFGEMVQSRIFLWQAIEVITGFIEKEVRSSLKLYVNQRDVSKMVGQNRINHHLLTERFGLDKLRIIGLNSPEKAWVGVGPWHQEVPQRILTRQSFLRNVGTNPCFEYCMRGNHNGSFEGISCFKP